MSGAWISEGNDHGDQNKFWPSFLHYLHCLATGRFSRFNVGRKPWTKTSSKLYKLRGQLIAPIEDGSEISWTVVVILGKADLEELTEYYKLHSYNSTTRVCAFCFADRQLLPFNHFSKAAAWVLTLFKTTADFQDYYRQDPEHHLLIGHPGVGPQFFGKDILHIGENRGITAGAIANCFETMLTDHELGPSYASGLAWLNTEIAKDYKRTGEQNRLPTLTRTCIRASTTDFPCLSNPGIKAANTRAILPFVTRLCIRLDDGSELRHKRRLCIEHLNCFYEIIYSASEFLSEAESEQVQHHVFQHLKYIAQLAQDAASKEKLFWGVVPKHHYFAHIGLESDYMNPRLQQTYLDESYIGRICEVFKTLLDGKYDKCLQKNVTTKVLLGIHILFLTT